ncbi:MAG: SOS response-associated peptidase [Austwickia sp.]|nr:SOS response-associated peptidase [Austwickia sp.]MBK8435923.1 SOS response-associated peptidase [Austwickia sp.]MBK9101607.1 SOS response-associated peptidase [Austwickia sp.]
MCGRYAAGQDTDDLVETLEIEADHTAVLPRGLLRSPQEPPPGGPDYNMSPSKLARVVLTRRPRDHYRDVRQLRLVTWGLVPSWAKDTAGAARMINARRESVFDRPAFRSAILSRRTLIPASGWFEWQVSPTATDARGKPLKQPFYLRRSDDQPLVFAGLYEFWRDRSVDPQDPASWLTTFAILTTGAEAGLDRIHDRQPVVLDRDHWAAWLDPGLTVAADVQDLLDASRPGRFEAYPVGRAVGNSRANGPALLEPADGSQLRGVVNPVTGEVLDG